MDPPYGDESWDDATESEPTAQPPADPGAPAWPSPWDPLPVETSDRPTSVSGTAVSGDSIYPPSRTEGVERPILDYLDPRVAGPFIARVLSNAGQDVVFDLAGRKPTAKGLFFADPAQGRHRVNPVPFVPLSEPFRAIVTEVQDSRAVGRDPRAAKLAPSREIDGDILSTPMCPESCFLLMKKDHNSRCDPLAPLPEGVEGGSNQRKAAAFRVNAWNKARDNDMRKIEDLSRDGLRVANLQTFVMAHVMRSLTDDSFTLTPSERLQALETLKELQHMSTRHLARITTQSVLTRRACAAEALNIQDQASLLAAPFGKSLFGEDWERIRTDEEARRQQATAAAALKAKKRYSVKAKPVNPKGWTEPQGSQYPPPQWGRGRGGNFYPAAAGAPTAHPVTALGYPPAAPVQARQSWTREPAGRGRGGIEARGRGRGQGRGYRGRGARGRGGQPTRGLGQGRPGRGSRRKKGPPAGESQYFA